MLSFLCKCCIIISTLLGVSLHLGDVSHFANKLSQFTTLINLAAGFFYLYWARASIRGEELENTRGFLCTRLALLLAVLTAGIVYHTVLAPAAAPKGAQLLATHLMHSVAPAAMLIDYLAFARKGRWTWNMLPYTLAAPVIYLIYLFIYKLCGGAFPLCSADPAVPYFFLSVKNLGFPGVLTWCAAIAAGILAVGALLILLDHKLAKPEPKLSKLTASLFGKQTDRH